MFDALWIPVDFHALWMSPQLGFPLFPKPFPRALLKPNVAISAFAHKIPSCLHTTSSHFLGAERNEHLTSPDDKLPPKARWQPSPHNPSLRPLLPTSSLEHGCLKLDPTSCLKELREENADITTNGAAGLLHSHLGRSTCFLQSKRSNA